MKNLISNFSRRFALITKPKRIKKYGIQYIIFEILILMCHRSSSKFEHYITLKRDKYIRKYLLENYGDIVEKYFNE